MGGISRFIAGRDQKQTWPINFGGVCAFPGGQLACSDGMLDARFCFLSDVGATASARRDGMRHREGTQDIGVGQPLRKQKGPWDPVSGG